MKQIVYSYFEILIGPNLTFWKTTWQNSEPRLENVPHETEVRCTQFVSFTYSELAFNDF